MWNERRRPGEAADHHQERVSKRSPVRPWYTQHVGTRGVPPTYENRLLRVLT